MVHQLLFVFAPCYCICIPSNLQHAEWDLSPDPNCNTNPAIVLLGWSDRSPQMFVRDGSRNLAKLEGNIAELEAKLAHEQAKFADYSTDLKRAETQCALDPEILRMWGPNPPSTTLMPDGSRPQPMKHSDGSRVHEISYL